MTTSEVVSISSVVGSLFVFLGITGIDAGLINNVVNGVISAATIVVAIITWWNHRNLIKS
jgi:hypothetical protein